VSSPDPEAERAQQVIERLLVDPVFRGEFRRDPVGACVAAGLPGLARELGVGVGSGLETLELRESRSSLAGVVMAAAVEGLSVAEARAFVEHGVHGVHGVKGVSGSSLGRGVRVPSGVSRVQGVEHRVVGEVRGVQHRVAHEVRAAGGAPAGGAPAGDQAGSSTAPASQAPGSQAAPAASAGSPAPQAGSGNAAPGAAHQASVRAGSAASGSASAASAAPVSAAAVSSAPGAGSASGSSSLPWPDAPGAGGAPAGGSAAVGSTPVAGLADGASSVAGGGSAGVAGLLGSPGLQASPAARTFLASRAADPRMVSVLGSVLSHHQVGVASVVSTSSPVHVQALEIVSVDGQPVGPDNFAARDLVTEIAAMGAGVRPDEIGTPWPIQSPGFFSDPSSQGSLRLAFEMPGVNAAAGQAGVVPGAAGAAVPGAAGAVPGAVPGAAGTPVYAAASYPAAAAPGAAVPGVVNPAAATAVPGSGASPASNAADQAQQLAGTGVPGPLSADPAAAAKVSSMVRFADSIIGKPYISGGGHGDWGPQPGYDCSGFVSAVLHAAGYLTHPVDTTLMPSQPGIEAGPGKFVTIFDRALPGQSGHVIMEINGQFYESGGRQGPWGGGGGVMKIGKPSADYLAAFPNVLHPQGL
jgi:hypothetical protein